MVPAFPASCKESRSTTRGAPLFGLVASRSGQVQTFGRNIAITP
jgi:hypothetical protein